jgi:hypothetical protein
VIGTSPVENEAWCGILRGIAIYKNELTAQEVASHYKTWLSSREDSENLRVTRQNAADYQVPCGERCVHGYAVRNVIPGPAGRSVVLSGVGFFHFQVPISGLVPQQRATSVPPSRTFAEADRFSERCILRHLRYQN